jgi:hypothetical protein
MLLRILKILGIMFGGLLVVIILVGAWADEPLPDGKEGQEAELLADSMLEALNAQAYESLETISWSFPRGHDFIWNKSNNTVLVRWDDYEVLLNTRTIDGTAKKDGQLLADEAKEKALKNAWKYFTNDSFWLVAPYKIKDPGTSRRYVQTSEGPGLLVTYTSGGVTPGDSYLWILDENYLPRKWKIWVSIIPIGGLAFTWEGWEQFEGAMLAKDHIGPFGINLELTNIRVE